MKSLCSVLGVYRGLQGAVPVKVKQKMKTDRGRKKEWKGRSGDRQVWIKKKRRRNIVERKKKESSG
jgi:hypothetical protein